jgi:hypothetical protein
MGCGPEKGDEVMSKQSRSGKSHSGGGRTEVKTPIRTGPPNTQKIDPGAVANLGAKVGNHTEMRGTINRPPQPLVQGTKPQVPMGNAVALNIGRGGPGAGRTVHGSGSQGNHGGGGKP